jgi:CsoR family transcriptional regulator, copper-sensing transcriptional repressor
LTSNILLTRHRVPRYNTPLGYKEIEEDHMRGYEINKDDYLKRLARIEGQVRGLQRMIEEDKYCIDVLTQVNAASAALKGVAVGLLDEHVRHCVREATESGDGRAAEEMVTEATRAIERLVRS